MTLNRLQLTLREAFNIKARGFSVVEVLVASAIFALATTTFVGSLLSAKFSSDYSSRENRAVLLAEEGLEAARNIRDADFANLIDGTYGISTLGNVFSLSGTSDVSDIFTRTLTVSTIGEDQKKIDVIVSWADKISPNRSVSLSTYLTNWRAVQNIEPGLTVNKTVINHGGSKVVGDFGPYKVTTTILVGDPPASTIVETPITIGEAVLLSEGEYTISEIPDSNYTQSFSGDCDSSGVITLAANNVYTCLITNEEKTSNLKVTKVVINHGGSKIVSDFPLFVDANPVVSGITNMFNSGVHTVSETSYSNYTQSFSGDCDSGGSVTLTTGVTKNCTITNEELIGPTVTTNTPIVSITQTTASGGGNVTSDGGASVTARGVVWDTVINPTIALSTKTSNGTGTGSFSSSLTSLTCNTLYHVRAYATNILGTSYGSDVIFTTSACNTVPTVDSSTSTSITSSGATLGATVQSLGIPASISARGVCYSTSANPSLTNGAICVTATLSQTVPGVFTISATSLTASTLYNYRGYATNSTGTGYTANTTFATLAPSSTITFIGAAAVSGETATIPTHQVGDLLIAFAYRDGNTNAPALPSGWINISSSGGGNANSSRLAYRIATGADSGAGWSNATEVIIQVYRGQSVTPIGVNAANNGNSTTVTYPALTLSVTNGTSWVIGFAGHRSTNTNLQNAPTLMTQRATRVDGNAEVAGHDTNGGVSSWSAQSVSVGGTSSGWVTRTLEIESQ